MGKIVREVSKQGRNPRDSYGTSVAVVDIRMCCAISFVRGSADGLGRVILRKVLDSMDVVVRRKRSVT